MVICCVKLNALPHIKLKSDTRPFAWLKDYFKTYQIALALCCAVYSCTLCIFIHSICCVARYRCHRQKFSTDSSKMVCKTTGNTFNWNCSMCIFLVCLFVCRFFCFDFLFWTLQHGSNIRESHLGISMLCAHLMLVSFFFLFRAYIPVLNTFIFDSASVLFFIPSFVRPSWDRSSHRDLFVSFYFAVIHSKETCIPLCHCCDSCQNKKKNPNQRKRLVFDSYLSLRVESLLIKWFKIHFIYATNSSHFTRVAWECVLLLLCLQISRKRVLCRIFLI